MNRQNTESFINILLAEDNPADVRLLEEALFENDINIQLFSVPNGVEAVSFLKREGEYKNKPRPDLFILDLNMPKRNGFEVLREIKGDASLKCIPVLVLSTSENENDISDAYHWYANCYLIKPANFDDFYFLIKQLVNFWVKNVRLPTFNGYLQTDSEIRKKAKEIEIPQNTH